MLAIGLVANLAAKQGLRNTCTSVDSYQKVFRLAREIQYNCKFRKEETSLYVSLGLPSIIVFCNYYSLMHKFHAKYEIMLSYTIVYVPRSPSEDMG
jgi:hypothetical protein